MQSLADRVILASGWTRRLIALLAGAVGALAMAPVNVGPAMVIPMTVAVWLLDGSSESLMATPRGRGWPGRGSLLLAFGAGWWLGFGYFLAGLWWLGAAFLVEPEFAWALPLGVIVLPAALALFPAAGFVLARLLWAPGASRVLALALGLGLAEWLRGAILTGFPWNAFGMALGGTLVTAQAASLIGLDGLTMVAIAVFAAPATLADDGWRPWRPTAVAIAVSLLLGAFGAARLAQPTAGVVPSVIVRIMQPGLTPDEKFRPENKDEILARYFELSRRVDPARGTKLEDIALLVWPESAFPFILTRDPQALSAIGRLLPPRTVLATGAAREEDVPATRAEPRHSEYYNTIEVIGSGGGLLDSYDKVHLVPFGEYLPFDSVLRRLGLRHFVSIPGGFEPGTRRRALAIPGLPPAAPSICYEAIFPGAVMPDRGSGPPPKFLLNVTNDGWFGRTPGPSQHFSQARLRTIEEGLPMIRAAATGISAIIDPYGRSINALAVGDEGVLDGPLPQAISEPFISRNRLAVHVGLPIFLILTLIGLRVGQRRRSD